MLRMAAAVVLVAHGVIHLIGFVVPFQLATLDRFPYDTTALNGAIELGDEGARILGLAWLVLAAGFVVAGVGVGRRAAWAVPLLVVISATSLVVCVLGLPGAAAGIVVNAVILAVIGLRAVLRPGGPSGSRGRPAAVH